MIIHLIRHAETEWHAADRYAGHTDIELTKKGVDQSLQLASWAKRQKVSHVFTSALKRSISTARPVCDLLEIVPEIKSELNEVNFGAIEGLTKLEFQKKYPDTWKSFIQRPATTQFPSGESGINALQRSLRVLQEISLVETDEEIIILSHGTLIRLLLSYLMEQELNKYRELFPLIDNVAITTFSLEKTIETRLLPENFRLYRYNSQIS